MFSIQILIKYYSLEFYLRFEQIIRLQFASEQLAQILFISTQYTQNICIRPIYKNIGETIIKAAYSVIFVYTLI